MAADPEAELDSRVFAARPEDDPVRRAVRLARVSAALLGKQPEVKIGRYLLIRELGTGGGGSVFTANDPQLGREVAVKLVAYENDALRVRALEEARRAAKLSHPHVVPVHDVGETGSHVFLIMELLTGPSLRDFAAGPATSRAVILAYLEAARGLAAIHAAGLVHRDFKPDNALFGADGRVRVVDFGLATAEADGRRVGTPGYMAPEQASGGPAVDQFALGVSLREALATRPRARHVERLIARATAPDPSGRFPHMQALVEALAHDPQRRRLQVAAGVLAVVLGAAAFGVGQQVDNRVCEGGAEALAGAWSPATVDEVSTHLAALGTPLAVAMTPGLTTRLGALGQSWLDTHRAACERHRREELNETSFARATACLARARAGLRDASALLSKASAAELDEAQAALMAVESPAQCLESEALSTPAVRDPKGVALEELHAVALLHTRAGTLDATALAEQVVTEARAFGEQRFLARALLTLGHARMQSDLAQAEAPLDEAVKTAMAEGADAVAVEAWARLAWVRGRSSKGDARAAGAGREVLEALGRRLGTDGRFASALLLNNLGSLEMTAGDFETARADLRRSVELAEGIEGPRGAELTSALTNLATVSTTREERTRLHARALERLRLLVGPDHAETLDNQLVGVLDDDDSGRTLRALAELCPRLVLLRPGSVRVRQRCALEWAWQAFALGDAAQVREAAGLIEAPLDPSALEGLPRQVAVWRALASGDEVTQWLAPLRLEAARERGSAWHHHLYAADAQLLLSAVERALGHEREAVNAALRAQDHVAQALTITGLPYGALLRRKTFAGSLLSAERTPR